MNLQAYANPYAAAVNPNFTGSIMASTGSTNEGDAVVTGSITGTTLTVTVVTSGALVVNSVLNSAVIEPATLIVSQLTGTAGGIGTYKVSRGQTVTSGTITATGTGKRVPGFTTTTGHTMQVQAASGQDLDHVDGLNLQAIYRSVYVNGTVHGVNRPALKGGDLLLIPTGLSATPPLTDTWLVKSVPEPWDAGGWTRVIVVLQQ